MSKWVLSQSVFWLVFYFPQNVTSSNYDKFEDGVKKRIFKVGRADQPAKLAFIDNEIKILVGTQLISKGFHFPNLNCIVILDIDFASRGYDIRSLEKTVQLYHQLSGRAGREGKPAKVYFQTINKKNNMISHIINPDPYIFLEKELEIRKKFKLPPFERFVSIIISCKDAQMSEKISFGKIDNLYEAARKDFSVLGGKIIGAGGGGFLMLYTSEKNSPTPDTQP